MYSYLMLINSTVIWYQVFLSNTNNSYIIIKYKVFISNTNNLYSYLISCIFIYSNSSYGIAFTFRLILLEKV